MKKAVIIIALITIILITCIIVFREKECPKCYGTGQTKQTCYYKLLEIGGYQNGKYSHDENCPTPGCRGYYYDECYTCKGTGKEIKD